ncbi:MAG: DNA helicase RecQ [Sphingomonadales bacterium]|nr:DNA helicase RecQ [Sphingomonadales bacterium]
MRASPEQVLADVFGYAAFRGPQADVIGHVMAGGSALLLMPTGGGKSLCYQVPALCLDGVAVVVSPLIALMRDQVTALLQFGVKAAALNSSLHPAEAAETEQALVDGKLDLIYVAPERLLSEGFLALLERCRVALFAIDEAHCMSQWGHDFRPEYAKLSILAERFGAVPRLALTATADGPTAKDIVGQLGIAPEHVFAAGFDRPNIRYRVSPRSAGRRQLLDFIRNEHPGQAGIVYCQSRKKAEETAAWLTAEGIECLPYHAGMGADARAANQDRFLKEDGLVMAATIAFGMGIDKPDVRFVAHMCLPKNMEAYYQETGRAGRDGMPAEALMLYSMQDIAMIRQFIEGSEAPDNQRRIEHQKLDALLGYCEIADCRRRVLLAYFGEQRREACGNCDNCLAPPRVFDGTEAARKFLSCVYRTGQRFGAGYVIDVLLGEESDRILKFGHDRLSTHGIGGEFSRRQWQSIARQLVARNLLMVDIAGHGGMRLGAGARAVLKGEEEVRLREDTERKAAPKKRRRRASQPLAPENEGLFEALRALRAELAQAQGVPPYVVFHDATLLAMAEVKPQTRDEFAELSGVGQAKLERYADRFIGVIRDLPES